MYIKLLEANRVIGDVYCCKGFTERLNDYYKDEVKKVVKEGVKILIRDNGEWIKGKKYFNLTKKDNEEDNDSIEKLKKKAKKLGIDNYWVMKEDTLKKKIKELQE